MTVGSGIAPDLLTLSPGGRKALAGSGTSPDTAGGELRPALRTGRLYLLASLKIKAKMPQYVRRF
jgi:hypothetical protein